MSRIETVSNVVVILAAGVVIGNNLYSRFVPPVSKAQQAVFRKLAGKPIALPASVPIGLQGTVTLFLAKDCHYCRESMDFYRRLASLTHEDNSCDIKLVAVGPSVRENRDSIRAYLADQNLKIDGADVIPFASVGISGTPTVVLSDSSQLVRNVWTGLLPASQEREVLERVKALCRN